MWERIRGEWIEGKLQNLLMLLRYNKDNLIWENNSGISHKIIFDCCLSHIKKWKLTKIGMKGIIDIEFENGVQLKFYYYPKKRPFNGEKLVEVPFSTLLEEIIVNGKEKTNRRQVL